jgi:hypothetical protein
VRSNYFLRSVELLFLDFKLIAKYFQIEPYLKSKLQEKFQATSYSSFKKSCYATQGKLQLSEILQ